MPPAGDRGQLCRFRSLGIEVIGGNPVPGGSSGDGSIRQNRDLLGTRMGSKVGGCHGFHDAGIGHHVIEDAQQKERHDRHQDGEQGNGLSALFEFDLHRHFAFQVSEREMNHSLFHPPSLNPSRPSNKVGA